MSESPLRNWRDSWSPSEHLQPPQVTDGRFALADDSPLPYFLTPALEDDADCSMDGFDDKVIGDDFMEFDLDAGIEGASHPESTMRSVSPSSLGAYAYGMPWQRPPTPPHSCLGDDDDDVVLEFPPDLHSDTVPPGPDVEVAEPWEQSYYQQEDREEFLYPTVFTSSPIGSPPSVGRTYPPSRGRLHRRAGSRSAHGSDQQGISIAERRSPRSWRVPSPEVFSIEEETEQQLVDNGFFENGAAGSMGMRAKKHVRFVLPDRDMA